MPDAPTAPQAPRAVAPTRVTAPPPAQPGPKTPATAPVRWLDVAGAAALALAAGFAAWTGLEGPLRLALALPLLLFAPGYLLLQATVVPPATGRSLGLQVLASVGISPAVVGVFALSTAIVAGAFKPGVIVALTTIGCVVLATVAVQRRRGNVRAPAKQARRERAPAGAPARPGAAPVSPVSPVSPAREAARAKSGPAAR